MDCADVERIISERDGRMLRGRPLRAHLRGCASCRALRDAIAGRLAAGAVGGKALAGAAVVATVAVGGAQIVPHHSSRTRSSHTHSTAPAASGAPASAPAPAARP